MVLIKRLRWLSKKTNFRPLNSLENDIILLTYVHKSNYFAYHYNCNICKVEKNAVFNLIFVLSLGKKYLIYHIFMVWSVFIPPPSCKILAEKDVLLKKIVFFKYCIFY